MKSYLLQGGSGDEWNYIQELSNVTMNRRDEDGNQEGSGQIPVPLTACDLSTASTPTTISSSVSLQVTFFSFTVIIERMLLALMHCIFVAADMQSLPKHISFTIYFLMLSFFSLF